MTEKPGKRQKGGAQSPTPSASSAGAGASPLDAVSELLAERAKYAKWLTELEAKRTAGTTSQKAYEKVRADYQGRLDGVLERLSSHASAMETHASELEARLEKLEESEAELEERREEGQLRNEVGELGDDEWEALSKKVERELSKVKQDKEVASSDLEKIRGLLATATPAHGTAKVEPGSDQKSEEKGGQDREAEVAVLPQAEAAPAPQVSAGAPPETPARTKEMDELEFLKSVVGSTPPGSTPPPQPRSSGAMPQAEAPAVKAAPLIKPPPARPAPAKSAPPVEQLVEQPKDEPLIGKGKGSMSVPDANPITIKPAAGGGVAQTKTLKCAECGALNYPSEWYCERCGAELTNV